MSVYVWLDVYICPLPMRFFFLKFFFPTTTAKPRLKIPGLTFFPCCLQGRPGEPDECSLLSLPPHSGRCRHLLHHDAARDCLEGRRPGQSSHLSHHNDPQDRLEGHRQCHHQCQRHRHRHRMEHQRWPRYCKLDSLIAKTDDIAPNIFESVVP